MRPLSEPPKTPEEIAAGTAALRPEGAVPVAALHRVLGGEDAAAHDLSAAQLTTLAQFYGLEPAYFVGSDAEVERFALDLPEDESTWSYGDREEYAQLMRAVLAEAAQHDAAREREGSGTANGSVSGDR